MLLPRGKHTDIANIVHYYDEATASEVFVKVGTLLEQGRGAVPSVPIKRHLGQEATVVERGLVGQDSDSRSARAQRGLGDRAGRGR